MSRYYGNIIEHWQAYCDIEATVGASAVTINLQAAGFHSIGWGIDIGDFVNVTATCTGQASKTGHGDFYCENGATVDKSYTSGTWTIQRTAQAQTVTVNITVTNSSGYLNGTSTISLTYQIPGLQSYVVSYDANGGQGAPAPQTKPHGVSIKLSTIRPTWSGHNFLGWGIRPTGAATYQPGDTYSANASINLYAIWSVNYELPTISNLSAARCNSSGTLQDDGTYAKITGSWSVSTRYDSTNVASTIVIEYRRKNTSLWSIGNQYSPNAARGSISAVIGGAFGADAQFEFRVTVRDKGGSAFGTCSMGGEYFPIDIGNRGRTVAIGRGASSVDGFEVGSAARFDADVTVAENLQSKTIKTTDLATLQKLRIAGIDDEHDVADMVVARGKTGEWTWRQWASGIQEAWLVHQRWSFPYGESQLSFDLPWTAHNTNYCVEVTLSNLSLTTTPAGFEGAHFITNKHTTSTFNLYCWSTFESTYSCAVSVHVLDRPWG